MLQLLPRRHRRDLCIQLPISENASLKSRPSIKSHTEIIQRNYFAAICDQKSLAFCMCVTLSKRCARSRNFVVVLDDNTRSCFPGTDPPFRVASHAYQKLGIHAALNTASTGICVQETPIGNFTGYRVMGPIFSVNKNSHSWSLTSYILQSHFQCIYSIICMQTNIFYGQQK